MFNLDKNAHLRDDLLTSDGDYVFLTNFFIPGYRPAPHYMENVRALWTSLCVLHGLNRDMGGKAYATAFEGVLTALGRSDEETVRYLEEYLDVFQWDDLDGVDDEDV